LELLTIPFVTTDYTFCMQNHLLLRKQSRRAFTLIEMLVVVTIIVLLLAFSTPALMKTMQSTRLSSTGDALMGAFSEAQQLAFAQSVPVELRFFSYDGEFGESPLFRAYQVFKVLVVADGVGANAAAPLKESVVPVGNLIKLSEGIVIAADSSLSPALSGEQINDEKEEGAIGYSGFPGATYCAMRFMPDGTCRKVGAATTNDGVTLASLVFQTLPESFLTITYDGGVEITTENLPQNFYTIQIDPFTGKARNYKPGF
jgi:uncharacterized protein (TIGR02596 family)